MMKTTQAFQDLSIIIDNMYNAFSEKKDFARIAVIMQYVYYMVICA